MFELSPSAKNEICRLVQTIKVDEWIERGGCGSSGGDTEGSQEVRGRVQECRSA